MERNFYIWFYDLDEDYALIEDNPPSIDDNYHRLCNGESCADWFPKNETIEISPDSGRKIGDAIQTLDNGFSYINERFKKLLEEVTNKYEYFPITVLNHKGKPLKESYYLCNLLEVVPCLDRIHSVYSDDEFQDGKVSEFEKMVLDISKIPESVEIFRLAEKTEIVIVSEDLAKRIALEDEIVGPSFVPVEDWDGFGA